MAIDPATGQAILSGFRAAQDTTGTQAQKAEAALAAIRARGFDVTPIPAAAPTIALATALAANVEGMSGDPLDEARQVAQSLDDQGFTISAKP